MNYSWNEHSENVQMSEMGHMPPANCIVSFSYNRIDIYQQPVIITNSMSCKHTAERGIIKKKKKNIWGERKVTKMRERRKYCKHQWDIQYHSCWSPPCFYFEISGDYQIHSSTPHHGPSMFSHVIRTADL